MPDPIPAWALERAREILTQRGLDLAFYSDLPSALARALAAAREEGEERARVILGEPFLATQAWTNGFKDGEAAGSLSMRARAAEVVAYRMAQVPHQLYDRILALPLTEDAEPPGPPGGEAFPEPERQRGRRVGDS